MQDRFSPEFRENLWELMRWRRDVRRFRTDPVEAAVLDRCLRAFTLAPSVGLSEPWRLIRVESPDVRAALMRNFEASNARALACYEGERAALYARLKLEGLREAPVQIAVFCDDTTAKGAGLGAGTMPEARAYSVVGAINLFWLALRAEGLGLGWVSILDNNALKALLGLPKGVIPVAYLCLGHVRGFHRRPELETAGWRRRLPLADHVHVDGWGKAGADETLAGRIRDDQAATEAGRFLEERLG